jgi:hypothetical protein
VRIQPPTPDFQETGNERPRAGRVENACLSHLSRRWIERRRVFFPILGSPMLSVVVFFAIWLGLLAYLILSGRGKP